MSEKKKKARIANIQEMEKELKQEREELKENKRNRKKAKRVRNFKKFFIFNFLLGTVCCYVGLIVVYGPNTKFRNWFITTAEASMRHKYYARWFYDEETISSVMAQNDVIEAGASTDTSLYNMDQIYATSTDTTSGKVTYKNEYERQILERDPAHLDYKIIEFQDEKLKSGRTFDGYLVVIYDASRIHTVATQYLGTRGEYLKDMAKRVNARVAINGGGFVDPNFNSNGATPLGITICKGEMLRNDESYNGAGGIIGFNEDDQLILTKCSRSQAQYLGIRDCVTFGPFIIVNGEASKVLGNGGWGVAPRTVIGQRSDGIVLFFVSDGRSGLKQGIDMNDEIEIMQRYGAINAANLDGGTSSVMIVEGEMINDPIDSTGAHKTRWISTGFYLEPEE
ncbi:MAG: phosphodiester glycosidase family protein [Clostridia bacterium]|nr:phosphodiester glycosidase family protein [Clostridia bacterium]